MLTKVKNVLMAKAPDGEASGDSGGSTAAAESTTNDATASDGATASSSGVEDGEGDNGYQPPTDTGDGFGDGFGSDFDFDAFLHYDPMKASNELSGKTTAEESDNDDEGDTSVSSKVPGEKSTEGKDPTKPAEGSKEKEPGQKEKENPEMELLREQVQNLTKLLNQQQQQANKATEQQEPTAKDKEDFDPQKAHESIMQSMPSYGFKIPAEVMKKFSSEDPREVESGLQEYATGIAQVTHYQVVMQMQQQFEQLRKELLNETVNRVKTDTQAEAEATKARSSIQKDFYGTFPELDKPELKTFIQTQAKFLAEQYGVQGWNEKFRDALGNHVKKILGISGQGPQPGDEENNGKGQQQQKQQKTRFTSGSGAGRSKPSGGSSLPDDVSDTLFS